MGEGYCSRNTASFLLLNLETLHESLALLINVV